MEIEKMVELFNKNKSEDLLSPFAQSYKQTISVFWNEVPEAAFYYVDLWVLNSITFKCYDNVSHHLKEIIISGIDRNRAGSGNVSPYKIEVGKKYNISQRKLNYGGIEITQIGIKNCYKITTEIIDRNKHMFCFTNLTPNRYVVRIRAEDKLSEEIATSKGIEIELIPAVGIHSRVDYESAAYGYTVYPIDYNTPKTWKKDEYYEEL